jgi:membrane protease YdiL (CAAX protease family)
MFPEHNEPSRTLPSTRQSGFRQRLRDIGRALVSLLLGGTAVLGAMLLFRKGVLPLVEAFFQPGEAWLSALRRVGIPLVALATYWAYVRWHEKRDATELRPQPLRLMLGGVGGAALLALPVALLFMAGAYEFVHWRGFSSGLWGVACVIAIAALLEELVYRCLLFRVLERACGTTMALVIQAVVFAIMHIANVEQGTLRDVATMLVSVTLLGVLWAGLFVLTRNLWVVAAHHAAWNFTIMLTGLPLSGIGDWQALAPLESRYAGPDWLTGGLFGPESSLVVMLAIAGAVAVLLHMARRRQAFVR